MDNVQWYYAAVIVIGTGVELSRHGEPKAGKYDFREDFIAMVLALPMTGRIFGWW